MTDAGLGNLTQREREIFSLIGQGLDSRQIADRLGIAYYTVRKHRSNMPAKLELKTAAGLSALAATIAPGASQNRISTMPGPP